MGDLRGTEIIRSKHVSVPLATQYTDEKDNYSDHLFCSFSNDFIFRVDIVHPMAIMPAFLPTTLNCFSKSETPSLTF